jgi:hypothetical protein
MDNIYIPILKAKPSEFKALEHTTENVNNRIVPLFDISDPDTSLKGYIKADTPKCDYIDDIVKDIAKFRKNKPVLFDGHGWFDDNYTETHEHVYSYMFRKLSEAGTSPIPVVGYDRWELPDYKQALKSINNNDACLIRLDSDAFEDAYDPEYFLNRLNDILISLNVSANNSALFLDFADVSKSNILEVTEKASRILELTSNYNFKYYVIAGCSMPPYINEAVKKPDSASIILRKEMVAWKAIKSNYPSLNVIFGDYGVRGPNAAPPGTIAPEMNGKLRYTVTNEYLVSRGHSQTKSDKWGQMVQVCDRVVKSGYFIGAGFSWGDEYIYQCSIGEAHAGGAKLWIAVDTNHHMAFVVAEIIEEVTKTVPIAA